MLGIKIFLYYQSINGRRLVTIPYHDTQLSLILLYIFQIPDIHNKLEMQHGGTRQWIPAALMLYDCPLALRAINSCKKTHIAAT